MTTKKVGAINKNSSLTDVLVPVGQAALSHGASQLSADLFTSLFDFEYNRVAFTTLFGLVLPLSLFALRDKIKLSGPVYVGMFFTGINALTMVLSNAMQNWLGLSETSISGGDVTGDNKANLTFVELLKAVANKVIGKFNPDFRIDKRSLQGNVGQYPYINNTQNEEIVGVDDSGNMIVLVTDPNGNTWTKVIPAQNQAQNYLPESAQYYNPYVQGISSLGKKNKSIEEMEDLRLGKRKKHKSNLKLNKSSIQNLSLA